MTTTNYPSDRTSLLLLDSYNDVLTQRNERLELFSVSILKSK